MIKMEKKGKDGNTLEWKPIKEKEKTEENG